jgi:glycine oxidase
VAVKAVIIGGGVVGCITAIKLKENGYDVTVVDKSVVGEESSAAGAGIIFPLMPWNYESRVFDLCLGALSFYKNLSIKLIKAGFEDPEFIESGMICIDPSDKNEIVQWGKKNNFTINEYLFDNKPSYELSKVAQINPKKLMKALKQYISKLGVELIENVNMRKIEKKSNYLDGWPTNNNEIIKGDFFVTTVGAWSSEINDDYKNKIYPIRGQIIRYPKSEIKLDKILYSKNFYLLQRKCGSILAGSTIENVGFDKTVTPKAANELNEKAINLVPELRNFKPCNQWAGLRPGVKGNIPFIEQDNNYKNVYINSGHYRYGLTMAPKSANEVLKLIEDK